MIPKDKLLPQLSEEMKGSIRIDAELFKKLDVKRGLRNEDGTGVLVGLTNIGNVVAWIAAVLFAYFTNKKYVFQSTADAETGAFREFWLFVSARLASLVLFDLLLFNLLLLLGMNADSMPAPAPEAEEMTAARKADAATARRKRGRMECGVMAGSGCREEYSAEEGAVAITKNGGAAAGGNNALPPTFLLPTPRFSRYNPLRCSNA